MSMTIMQQLQQVFADTKPVESPSTVKLYHASIGRDTPCRRVLAHSDAEAALKAGKRYPGAYVSRGKTCRHCATPVVIYAGTAPEDRSGAGQKKRYKEE